MALIPGLVLQPNIAHSQLYMPQALVGTLYMIVCVSGTIAVFYPKWCSRLFRKPQNPLSQAEKRPVSLQIEGHHPNCDNYATNRIKLAGRNLCAACSGLLLGAIIGMAGAVLYFFYGLNFGWDGVWLLVLGELLMFLGLAQIRFSGYTKVATNLLFVVGSYLLLVETDVIGKNVLIDFYALGVIVFMLWLRIWLSEWHNKRTCLLCSRC